MKLKNKVMKLSKTYWLSVIAISTLYFGNYANGFEFDGGILEELGVDNVDLSAFSGGIDAFSHSKNAVIVVNGERLLYDVPVYHYTKNGASNICFTSDFIDKLPLKDKVGDEIKKDPVHDTDVGHCYGFEEYDNQIKVAFDNEYGELKLQIPHLYLSSVDQTWIVPSKRDNGVAGVFIDYSINANHNAIKNRDNINSIRSYGTVGANYGKIRFRANYQYDSKANYREDKFEWAERYAFMDVGTLNSKLYAGEIFSRSNIFDNVRFKGISLYSDESMMPRYLQGYAPQITGVVGSDATVTVSQYGRVLRQVDVPAGGFSISDLPSYTNGLVDVEIEEIGGAKRSYQVDIAHVPFLTRPGSYRYSLNAGKINRLINDNSNEKENFFSIDASYGVNNALSVYGGTQFTTNNEYRAIALGLGLSLGQLGAISFDVTQSRNKALSDNTLSGHSYRFNYAKRFGENLNLNLVGYRFSSRNYTTLNNYLDMRSNPTGRATTTLEKNRFTIEVSQYFEPIATSFGVSATRGTYWNDGNVSSFQLSANRVVEGGFFRGSSIQLSASRTKMSDGSKENYYMLMLSIPVGDEYDQLYYSAAYSDESRRTSQNVSYGSSAFGGDYNIGVATSQHRDFSGSIDYSLNASFDKDMAFSRVGVRGFYTDNTKSISGNMDGSITLTKGGIATHKRVYNDRSRLILDVGAPGVHIEGQNTRSNIFGLAGVSNVPEYRRTTYHINNDMLPDDVEMQESVVDVAITDGAIAYRKMSSISGQRMIATVFLENGSHPPFGAVVYRENGEDREAGMVSEQGLVYLAGINQNAVFKIKWNGSQSCQLKISSIDIQSENKLTCYMD